MFVGIIPPIPELDLARGRKFHLCLSHLCKDERYVEFYRREADRGAFICLDNSAHENGSGEDIQSLIDVALKIGAREIVLPDELFSREGTVLRTEKALQQLSPTDLRLMIVPQAKIESASDYWFCLENLFNLVRRFEDVFQGGLTIGISKDYEKYPMGLPQLVEGVVLRTVFEDTLIANADIHLLGWGRKLTDLGEISSSPMRTNIRSTDSAKPIMFALAGIDLSLGLDVKYPGRIENYFYQTLSEEQRQVARRNIRVFERTASCGGRDVS